MLAGRYATAGFYRIAVVYQLRNKVFESLYFILLYLFDVREKSRKQASTMIYSSPVWTFARSASCITILAQPTGSPNLMRGQACNDCHGWIFFRLSRPECSSQAAHARNPEAAEY